MNKNKRKSNDNKKSTNFRTSTNWTARRQVRNRAGVYILFLKLKTIKLNRIFYNNSTT